MAILHIGIFFYIFSVHGSFHHCIIVMYVFVLICLWMLYLCLLRYVFLLHIICSLVAPHIGNRVTHISCILFVIPFLPYALTYIHNIGLTNLCLNYLSHVLKHLYLFLVSQYLIYLFLLLSFLLLLTLREALHLKPSTL